MDMHDVELSGFYEFGNFDDFTEMFPFSDATDCFTMYGGGKFPIEFVFWGGLYDGTYSHIMLS